MKKKKDPTKEAPQPKEEEKIILPPARIVIKFKDDVSLPYQAGIENILKESEAFGWKPFLDEFPNIKIGPLFTRVSPDKIKELLIQASDSEFNQPVPRLMQYYAVTYKGEAPVDKVVSIMDNELEHVAFAYRERPAPPPAVSPSTNPDFFQQGFHTPAPDGIDAECAWTFPGGGGQGIRFMDLEQGWTLNHEDLINQSINLISGLNRNIYRDHGTAVLGIVNGEDNALGGLGIASEATAAVISQWTVGGIDNTPDAILDGIAHLSFGDVFLLEAQRKNTAGNAYVPLEYEPALFDAILVGSMLGICMIEPAANGTNPGSAIGVDLNGLLNTSSARIFDRTHPQFQDSGAIYVGAATSSVPHERIEGIHTGDFWASNYGNRVDCYAWGENIFTSGFLGVVENTTSYVNNFDGTSGASAIIAGAAVALQGIAEQNNGFRLSPLQMRKLLSDVATGTASNDPPIDQIGVMPDLCTIIGRLGLTPDVYMRDNLSDTGAKHTGSIASSPDIFVLAAPVANPQTDFGAGSPTANNILNANVTPGQDNFVYVRANNRGGADASNVQADLYWSPAATLVTPNMWTAIGSVTLPSVPVGVLTASPDLLWPSADLPAPGHYCFVGILSHALDPAPLLTNLSNWDNFRAFVRNNNNVTWRNFNVVSNTPAPSRRPAQFVALPFLLTGAFDRREVFTFEIESNLPPKSNLQLELGHSLSRQLLQPSPFLIQNRRTKRKRQILRTSGITRLRKTVLPAKLKAKSRLLVQIPEYRRKHDYEITFKQFHKGEEVGRISWRLTHPDKLEQGNQF